jgi:hypothetical protein
MCICNAIGIDILQPDTKLFIFVGSALVVGKKLEERTKLGGPVWSELPKATCLVYSLCGCFDLAIRLLYQLASVMHHGSQENHHPPRCSSYTLKFEIIRHGQCVCTYVGI